MTPAIERAAQAAADRAANAIAEGLREVPGVFVTVSGGDVTIEGRGLARRALVEPALRWPAEGAHEGLWSMSAGAVLQAAVAAALREEVALEGVTVFDAAPVRAALPHAVVEEPMTSDWSAKDWRGREARLAVLVHDAGERPVRLRGLAAAVEDAVAALDPDIGDAWRVASLVFVRGRIVRGAGERWISASEFRVRMRRL